MADEIKTTAAEAPESRNFIHTFIEEDIAQGGQFEGMTVHTRFPPEPNGYLHIGHAKSICLNFGLAADYKGVCHMRFDDTNPVKEDQEYVDAIKESVRWMGFDWKHGTEDNLYHASDYFDWMYQLSLIHISEPTRP